MTVALEAIYCYLPPRIAAAVSALPESIRGSIDEIRLRKNRAASVTCGGKNVIFDKSGTPCQPSRALCATEEELRECLSKLAGGSLYTCDGTLAQGFIPLPIGGRAGVCGRAEKRSGKIVGFYEIFSIDLRLHRFLRDLALPLVREFERGGLCGALVISPPAEGKTTFLRSAAYLLANGIGCLPKRVAIADEREEITAALPQSGLVDVLSGAPKAEAMTILTRTLSPQVLICDELAGSECDAVLEAQNCGVALIASAHGGGFDQVLRRPGMKRLIDAGVFGLCVLLKRGESPEISSIPQGGVRC